MAMTPSESYNINEAAADLESSALGLAGELEGMGARGRHRGFPLVASCKNPRLAGVPMVWSTPGLRRFQGRGCP